MRRLRLILVVGLVSLSCVLGTSTSASADAGADLLANSWVIGALAEQGYGAAAAVPASAEVASWEAAQVASATVGTTARAGVTTAPKAGGKLGMVLNTVAVLGGLSFLWGGGSDAPALPMPPLPETASGAPGLGWSTFSHPKGVWGNDGTGRPRIQWTSADLSVIYYTAWNLSTNTVVPGYNCTRLSSSNSPQTYSQSVAGSSSYGMRYDFYQGTGGCATMPSIGQTWAPKTGTTMPNPKPGGGTTDPSAVPRYIDSQVTCKSSGGGSQTLTRRDGPFTFNPAQPYAMPEVPDMVCPDGTWLDSGTRELHTDGTDETSDVPLQEPYQAPDWVPDQVTRFPECYPAAPTMCQLELVKVGTSSHPDYRCHEFPMGTGNPCADWWTDLKRDQHYQCLFGTTVVALGRCKPYRQQFITGDIVQSDPNPDAPLPPPVEADPTPDQTPDLGDCTPQWADLLTPWWVFKATSCSLKWAFVPKTSVESRIGTIKDTLTTRAPFSWIGGFAGLPTVIPGGECPDWRVRVPNPGGTAVDANVVCDSTYTAQIRASRPVFAAFMVTLALWPLIRSTAYAAFPIIKPQPGLLK